MSQIITSPHALETDVIDVVQELIRINIDSSQGFDSAASQVDQPELAMLFRRLSLERRRFAEELRPWIRASGAEPETAGTLGGAFHQWWTDLRHALNGAGAAGVLRDAAGAEDSMKRAYEHAMVRTAGIDVHPLVERQYRAIKAGHELIQDMMAEGGIAALK